MLLLLLLLLLLLNDDKDYWDVENLVGSHHVRPQFGPHQQFWALMLRPPSPNRLVGDSLLILPASLGTDALPCSLPLHHAVDQVRESCPKTPLLEMEGRDKVGGTLGDGLSYKYSVGAQC